ncbi:MsnO8 family LLM class oxidoreductase [Paenibacillus sp. HJL G12]|uniref:MsnO8 family LLM class oxidoreductase n=1 Tax=Paenibacillus dendrobii TaxID=2691084 RepID=A0A7X3III1_9BACL|nr:LLM class flavin-dependent oxidoreductase [Paenibacillus dendrobii]MWV44562.1 MsnO8 family LLM class oxidoreductase [Paenibacillus dendrobii]
MRELSLSVLDLVPKIGDVSYETALQEAAELAVSAEQWGYKRYWAAEHHDLESLSCASPEVLLAHIGAKTSRIRLGTGALLLPHYSPLKVAESFRLLAALYPGRIDLGIGRAPGGSAHASMALSGNFLQNVADMPKKMRALIKLLEDRYVYEEQRVLARPFPQTQPDLWMLGTNNKSAGFAAEYGTGYVFGQFMSERDGAEVLKTYQESFRPSALLDKPRMMVAIGIICAETEQEAERLLQTAKLPGPERTEPDQRAETQNRLIHGTAEQVRDQLNKLADACGCEEFLVFTPVQDYRKRLESYRMLASSCM